MSSLGVAINGKYYSWSSVRFNFLGRSVTAVQAIKYEEEDEIKDVKAVGTKKHGYTQGNTTTSASITLLAEAVEQITRSLPGKKRIQDIAPFPITVSYIDDAGLLVSHVLEGVKMMKNVRDTSSGSTDAIGVEIPLHVHDIDWKA